MAELPPAFCLQAMLEPSEVGHPGDSGIDSFCRGGHPKQGLEEAGRIEKRDCVEGTGLVTHVAMGPGWICAQGMRSAWQEVRSPLDTYLEDAGARRGMNVHVWE